MNMKYATVRCLECGIEFNVYNFEDLIVDMKTNEVGFSWCRKCEKATRIKLIKKPKCSWNECQKLFKEQGIYCCSKPIYFPEVVTFT